MKITHIIFTFNTGGAETMLVDIMNRQADMGHDVSLLIINDGVDPGLLSTISPAVTVTHWPRRPGSGKLQLALRLNWWVRRQRPDVVHLHDPKLPGLLRGMDRKLLYTVHDLDLSQHWMRPTVRQAAISRAVMDNALEQNPQANVCVVENGINIDAIAHRGADGAHSPLRIVQLARLDSSKKGQDILISALGLLKSRGVEDVSVDFIGEGADLDKLKAQVCRQGVERQVVFRGLMTRKEIYQELASYDLMVHPARYEGFGLVIAEAMSAGLPVAVPRGGGPYEVVGKGEFGEVFAPDDPQSVADAIERIRSDYPAALRRAEAARAEAAAHYSLEAQVDAYMRIYRR